MLVHTGNSAIVIYPGVRSSTSATKLITQKSETKELRYVLFLFQVLGLVILPATNLTKSDLFVHAVATFASVVIVTAVVCGVYLPAAGVSLWSVLHEVLNE